MNTQDAIQKVREEILYHAPTDGRSLLSLRLDILVALIQKRETEKAIARIDKQLKETKHG